MAVRMYVTTPLKGLAHPFNYATTGSSFASRAVIHSGGGVQLIPGKITRSMPARTTHLGSSSPSGCRVSAAARHRSPQPGLQHEVRERCVGHGRRRARRWDGDADNAPVARFLAWRGCWGEVRQRSDGGNNREIQRDDTGRTQATAVCDAR